MITIRILPKLLASLAILFLSAAPLAVFADGIPFAPGWQIVPPCEDTPPPAPVSGKISQAHGIFWSVGLGFMWVLGAWFVVKLISDALLKGVFKATGL